MSELLLPEGYESELELSPKQYIVLMIIFGFVFVYFFSWLLRDISPEGSSFYRFFYSQYSYIMSDWQLALAFIGIFALTLGWYVLQTISILIINFKVIFGAKVGRKRTTIARIIISGYFLALLWAYFFFGYKFDEIMLYLSAIFTFSFIVIISYIILKYLDKRNYLKGRHRKREERIKNVLPKKKEVHELKNSDLIKPVFIIIIIVILIFLYRQISDFWVFIHADIYIAIYFWIVICITILWKPLCLIGNLISLLPNYFIKTVAKRKISRFRFLLFIFFISMLIFKNLPYYSTQWGWEEWQIQIATIILSALTSALAFYISKRFLNK